MKPLKPSCLCLSALSLLSCAPYEKCDESLRVGDELTFKLTEGPSELEQIDECGAPLPFDVGSAFYLTVEKFIGGDRCDSTTGPVTLNEDVEFEWKNAYDSRTFAKFKGTYVLDSGECALSMNLKFYDDRVRYNILSSGTCVVYCEGEYKGEWIE